MGDRNFCSFMVLSFNLLNFMCSVLILNATTWILVIFIMGLLNKYSRSKILWCKLYVSKLLFSTVIVSNYNLILSAFFQPKILPVLPFDGPEKSILGSSDTLLIEMIPKIKMSCQYILMFQFIIYLSSHQEWVLGSISCFTKF